MKTTRALLLLSALLSFGVGRVSADAVYIPPSEELAETGGAAIMIYLCFSILIWIVQLFARARMLERTAGNGWRILIPLYGRWLEYKTYWKTLPFFVNRALFMVAAVVCAMIDDADDTLELGVLLGVIFVCVLAVLVNRVLLKMHTMPHFGFSRMLGLPELIGLGALPDLFCAFSNRSRTEVPEGEAEVLELPHDQKWE